MQGDAQKTKDPDISALGSVMNQNSKAGNPRSADKGGLNANYETGSAEKDVKSSKGTQVSCSNTLDCDYTK